MTGENSLRDIRVIKLTKATYGSWKIEICDVFESYRTWKITTGKTVKPREMRSVDDIVTNVKEIDDWKAKDNKAQCYSIDSRRHHI